MKETIIEYPSPKRIEPDKVFETVEGSDLIYVTPYYAGIYFSVYQNRVIPRGDRPLSRYIQGRLPNIDSSRFQFFYIFSKDQLILLDIYDHEARRFLQPEEFSMFPLPDHVLIPSWEKRPASEVLADIPEILRRFPDGAVVKRYRDDLVVFSIVPQPPAVRREKEKEE
ncbi:MAG: hypothetical protein QXF26_02340 [Candidatus Bathyarchaeia archaeon]